MQNVEILHQLFISMMESSSAQWSCLNQKHMHAYCIARKRPEGLSFDSGNNFFCCASPHLLFQSTYRRSRASNLLILTFFPHPKIENSPRMISSPYWRQITSFHDRRISNSPSHSLGGGKSVYRPAFSTIRSSSWPQLICLPNRSSYPHYLITIIHQLARCVSQSSHSVPS